MSLSAKPFVAAILLAGVASAQQTHAIEAEISLARDTYVAGQPIPLEVTFRNVTDKPVVFSNWNTPFEGFKSDMFDVTLDGQHVAYEGRLFKRLHLGQDTDAFLAPNAELTTSLNLRRAYGLDVDGTYTVALSTYLPSTASSSQNAIDVGSCDLESNLLTFNIVGAKLDRDDAAQLLFTGAGSTVIAVPGPIDIPVNTPTFVNCSDAQQTCITDALGKAREGAKAAKDCLDKESEAYTKWFGKFSEKCAKQVKDNFCKISDSLNDKSYEFTCDGDDCEPGDFGYVYPCTPCKIYLCGGFFSADLTGTDSKMGVLIHEASHFKDNGGTDDHEYGCEDSCELAETDPEKAKDNADNYEYFVEKGKAPTKTPVGLAELVLSRASRPQTVR